MAAIGNKRRRGSGLSYVESALFSPQSHLSVSAKDILQGLLGEHRIEMNKPSAEIGPICKPRTRKPIDTNMSDERIMQLAQEGELSFLASLLTIIEEEQGPVTTKLLIKACCLSVEPAKVPVFCDGKEMVMSALHFMSQSFQGDLTYFPMLPLIRPTSTSADLEKRAYVKVGDWMLQDVLTRMLHLEEVFYESCKGFQWMAREHFCPKLTNGRKLLLLKGSAPSLYTAKMKKATAGGVRKKPAIVKETTQSAKEDMDAANDPTSSFEPHEAPDGVRVEVAEFGTATGQDMELDERHGKQPIRIPTSDQPRGLLIEHEEEEETFMTRTSV